MDREWSKMTKPDKNDWYETVKVNYGIRPDGSKIFRSFLQGMIQNQLQNISSSRNVPDSWIKFKDIALFWTGKGVDGFRYDM
jgi:hypothetical protein